MAGITPKRRAILACTLMSVAMATAFCPAQDPPAKADWNNLRHLVQGAEIRVVLNNRKSFRARFETFDGEAIVVSVATGRETLARESILRVSVRAPRHVRRNIMIGMAVGAAGGASVVALTCRHAECRGPVEGIGALFGMPVGALVGGIMPTGGWHEVYWAPVTAASK
jgi:hypothetical protein